MILGSVLRDLFRPPEKERGSLLTIVVNFYNNRREALNTLHSLTRGYQVGARDLAYEVIALDNGSPDPLSEADVLAFGPEFRYQYVDTGSPSPVGAINGACRDAAGDRLMVLIDGAHILSPGVLQRTNEAFAQYRSPFVATAMFHIGPKMQNYSVQEGYDQKVEDALLERSQWRYNGYRLYSIAGAFADDSGGWYGQLFESGCFAMRKADYLALGGFDERFQSPGGGLTNLDLFQRALMTDHLDYVVLLGEGTFHQFHGGVATNASIARHPWKAFHEEYVRIRGHGYVRIPRRPALLGEVPREAARAAAVSKKLGDEMWVRYPAIR